MSDYWNETASEALEDAGIEATKEQIDIVASWIESAHENYGMTHNQPSSGDFSDSRVKELERKLAIEQNKVNCSECGGSGSEYIQGPCHSSHSTCWKCNGEGRVSP